MGSQFEIKTKKNGYCFFEVASAFQKAIRRCDEAQAMFWAVELYESGMSKYAWKRMIIMASEDIGAGDRFVITAIMALKQSFDYLQLLKEKSQPEKLPFTQAVLTLVYAKKSRYVDLAISHYWKENNTKRYTIPDYAFDMHTRKGKAMGRGLDHFYREAAHINNPNKLPKEVEMEKLALVADKAGNPYIVDNENLSCTEKEGNEKLQGSIFDNT